MGTGSILKPYQQMLAQSLLMQLVHPDGMISIIGVAAAVLTTSSFLPQIMKAHKRKSMEDVSPYLMGMFSSGTLLWMLYGIYKTDMVIVGANGLATAFNAILLYMKFAYRKKLAKQTKLV
jgi:MtN3 and saliva related transmembrane protein